MGSRLPNPTIEHFIWKTKHFNEKKESADCEDGAADGIRRAENDQKLHVAKHRQLAERQHVRKQI